MVAVGSIELPCFTYVVVELASNFGVALEGKQAKHITGSTPNFHPT